MLEMRHRRCRASSAEHAMIEGGHISAPQKPSSRRLLKFWGPEFRPSRNTNVIILPKSWSGHGRTDRTGSAGPICICARYVLLSVFVVCLYVVKLTHVLYYSYVIFLSTLQITEWNSSIYCAHIYTNIVVCLFPLTTWCCCCRLGFSIKKQLKEDVLYKDRDSQVNAINDTFELVKKPVSWLYSHRPLTTGDVREQILRTKSLPFEWLHPIPIWNLNPIPFLPSSNSQFHLIPIQQLNWDIWLFMEIFFILRVARLSDPQPTVLDKLKKAS